MWQSDPIERFIGVVMAILFFAGACVAFALLPWYWALPIGVVCMPMSMLSAIVALLG